MKINLDEVNFVHLSGGEVHLNAKDFHAAIEGAVKRSDDEVITLWSPLRNPTDIMELLIFTDAIRRSDYRDYELNVIIPYVPYARQDRVANVGESLTSKVFADIINAQKYHAVIVFEAHSDVILALLDNVYNAQMDLDFQDVHEDAIIVAPDAGAYKKLRKRFPDRPMLYAVKSRDTKTGKLTKMTLISDGIPPTAITDKKLVVVDDICDGGATFNLLAESLREQGYDNDLELVVTHGIFSKGFDELKKNYKHIYTTNSFYQGVSDDFVTVFDMNF